MRNAAFFLKEAAHLSRLIIKAEGFQKNYPDDDAIVHMLNQYNLRRDEMLELYRARLREEDKHSIQFAIKTEAESLPVPDFMEYLKNFWSVLKNTYKNLLNTSKSFNLNFDTTFYGSFGVQLSAPRDPDKNLFEDNTEGIMIFFFDIAEWINSIVHIDNKNDVTIAELDTMFKGSRILAKRYLHFYKKIYEKEKSLEIKWKSTDKEKNVIIDAKKIARFINIIEQVEKQNIEEINIFGSIKGVSLLSNTIEFLPRDKSLFDTQDENPKKKIKKINATFDSANSEAVKISLDKVVNATFKKTYEMNENEDAVKIKYHLSSIQK